jgi:hypothetical protein
VKQAVLLLALVACSSKAPDRKDAAVATELTLPSRAPAVGLVIHEDSTQHSTVTLTRDTETTALTQDERETSRSEVLEVSAGAITKVKIHYDARQSTRSVDGVATVEPSPLEGHTYVVWVEATEIKAARDDGSPVGDAEAEALAEDHGDLGQVPPVSRILAARTWKRDAPVLLDAAELAGLSKDPKVRVTGGTFTWLGDGEFVNQASLVKDDDKARVENTMTTRMKIDLAEVRPTEIESRGTSTGELRGAMAGTTLTGTSEAHATYQYGGPPSLPPGP